MQCCQYQFSHLAETLGMYNVANMDKIWLPYEINSSDHVILFLWRDMKQQLDTCLSLQREALWAALRFVPRGDVSDLDRQCLSTSAGHKGGQAKLFILTSFQQNKPCTVGASVPQRSQLPQTPL